MRILQFKVTGQNLSKDGDFSGIVAGTKGYLYTAYNFDGEWDGCKKAAVFVRYGTFAIHNRDRIFLVVSGKDGCFLATVPF